MDEAEVKKEGAREERRFSQEQYDMLKRCSEKKDMTEWNEWRKHNSNEEIWLEGAVLTLGHLDNGFFLEAHLEGACLRCAALTNANMCNAHLEGADLVDSELEGTKFNNAYLQNAKFQKAQVDGKTSFCYCEFDRETDFREVGLDSCIIDSGTKQLLEYNVRRMNWEEWYKEHWFWRWPFRLFWLFSDYGASGKRVVGVFFLLAFLFAGIYLNCAYWRPPGIVSNLVVQPETEQEMGVVYYFWLALVRPVYFSIVTMTTLGFGDMYANKGSIAGHVILAVQVILGYVLLGALVTRFAVLFTAGGPAGRFAEEKKKTTK